MSRYQKLIERALAPDDFAQAAVRGLPCIRMASNKVMHIDGHCGISEYSGGRIVAAVKNGEIVISGENLSLSGFSRDYLKIKGEIYSVEMRKTK